MLMQKPLQTPVSLVQKCRSFCYYLFADYLHTDCLRVDHQYRRSLGVLLRGLERGTASAASLFARITDDDRYTSDCRCCARAGIPGPNLAPESFVLEAPKGAMASTTQS